MREDLIAYALGELGDDDRQRVEAELAGDPSLREELAQIKQCLGGADDAEADCQEAADVPQDLTDRTTFGILSGALVGETLPGGNVRAFMSPIDMTVAIGILITIGCLLLPALYNRRNHAQQLTCTDNLRELGQLMTLYSEGNENYYPVVRPYEHAGIFATRLREADLVSPYELDRRFVCPSSPLAEKLSVQSRDFHVPSFGELSMAKGPWLADLIRHSSGSYGYQVGYRRGDYYLPNQNVGSSIVPVIADAPSRASNFLASDNHGGAVVNTLFQDGSVRALQSPRIPCGTDHLFLNEAGEPSIGLQWNDAVVLPSEVTPGVQFPVKQMPEAVYRLIFRVE